MSAVSLMKSDEESHETERTEEFVRLVALHSRDIYRCIHGLVINRDAADDIYQETSLVIWREYGRYVSGTDFLSWAKRIAVNQVLAWRKRVQRNRLIFNEAFLLAVADETERNDSSLRRHKDFLPHCMEKLGEPHRRLIAQRYEERFSIDEIAARNNKTIDAVYRALSRIRRILHDCVTRRLALERHD